MSGVRANRELPVVWSVAKGSFVNKVILVPLALLISAFIPRAITPLLMIGGAFLCFEGVEKVLHTLQARKHQETPEERQQRLAELAAQDPLTFEKDKIKGAVRTDFILSAEIVAITLGIVADAPLLNQVLVLSGIALAVTVGVYGWLALSSNWTTSASGWLKSAARSLRRWVKACWWWRLADENAVGGRNSGDVFGRGGIVVHGIAPLHHAIEQFAQQQNSFISMMIPTLLNLVLGFIIGGIVVLLVKIVSRLRGVSH